MAELTERLQSATTSTPSSAVAAPVEVAPAPTPVRAMRAMGSNAVDTHMEVEPVASATDPEVEIAPYQSRRYEPVQEYDALDEPTQVAEEPTSIPQPFIPPVAQKAEPQARMHVWKTSRRLRSVRFAPAQVCRKLQRLLLSRHLQVISQRQPLWPSKLKTSATWTKSVAQWVFCVV